MAFKYSPSSVYSCQLTRPEIVGFMSVDVNRDYHADLSELKFITHFPKGRISLDLNHNMENAVKRTSSNNVEKIDLLLKFLLDQSHRLPTDVNFITYRRTLISVICSAFGLEPIIVVACWFKSSIYLCSLETPDQEKRKLHATEQDKKFLAWGYKFEQYMNADLPNAVPDTQKPVQENAEFSLFYKAALNSHTVLYGAQIDGLLATSGNVACPQKYVDYETNLNYLRKNTFVELKTNREIQYRKQEDNFKKNKMLKTWCQCYLAGLKGVIIGYRNDQGIVQSLQSIDTEEIPKYCQGLWDPTTGLQFLDYFLTYVKNTFDDRINQSMRNNDDFGNIGPFTLRFDIDTKRRIKVTENCEEILPQWCNGKGVSILSIRSPASLSTHEYEQHLLGPTLPLE